MANRRYATEIVTSPRGKNQRVMDNVVCVLNDALKTYDKMPNAEKIMAYNKLHGEPLPPKLLRQFLNISTSQIYFDPKTETTNKIIKSVSPENRRFLRVTLDTGLSKYLKQLKLEETSHHMILYFVDNCSSKFLPTEKHPHPPIFSQGVDSEHVALLYIEAMLLDSMMCHHMGISDAAMKHNGKQRISTEKVEFICAICQGRGQECYGMSDRAWDLIRFVAKHLTTETPYISFLSIFTVASLDYVQDTYSFDNLFNDYFSMWKAFQKWYFLRHNMVLSCISQSGDTFNDLFPQNKYKKQISAYAATRELKKICDEEKNARQGKENAQLDERYAFIIIKRVPKLCEDREILEGMFGNGKIHQASWKIINWKDWSLYSKFSYLIEVVPFLITL